MRRKVRVLQQASLQYLRISPKKINDALLPSTATAHTCRVLFSKARSKALTAHDVVVGPTYDGGYYLVGAKASHPTLFASDGMGTSSALEKLLSRARALGLSVGLADPFYDIDVADDLNRLAAELRLAPARAPRTAEWLKEWELVTAQSRTGSGDL